jgi:CRISPR system Cascade subunit CasA
VLQFDVRTEPWLPVLEPGDSVREVGLLDALRRAHELRDLATASPLEYVAAIRLLVAIVHRALDGPRTEQDGRVLYRSGRIPDQVLRYLEGDASVWDLFDRNRPWLQTPSAANAAGQSPLSRLLPWLPTGNNPVLWDHTYDAAFPAFTPAEAARALLVAQSYGLAGSAGTGRPNFTDGTVAGSLVCVAIGDSLAQTLLLNAVRYADDDPMPRGDDDAPAWERSERPSVKEKTLVDGYVDFLTLSTRRVLLMRDPDGLVRRCLYAQGLAPREIGARDPFVPYRETTTGLVPMRASAERALWRDLPAIAAGLADQRETTGVLRWAARLLGDTPVHLRAVGLVRLQAKVDMVVDGELRIPPPIALSIEHREALADALTVAEESANAVRRALRTAAERAGAGAEAAQTAKRLMTTTPFWARLEGPYDALVDALSALDEGALVEEHSAPAQRWADGVRYEARRSYEQAVGLLGSSPRELIAAARGRNQLEGWLHRHLVQPAAAVA